MKKFIYIEKPKDEYEDFIESSYISEEAMEKIEKDLWIEKVRGFDF